MIHRDKIKGFTLLEISFVVAIIGILVAIVIPDLAGLWQREQAKRVIQQLCTAINTARSEALKRGGNVVICPTPRGQRSCVHQQASRGAYVNWSGGYMTFIGDDDQTPPPAENILKVYTVGNGKLGWKGNVSSTAYLVFTYTGLKQAENGHFLYCSSSQTPTSNAVALLLENSRPRIAGPGDKRYTCADF